MAIDTSMYANAQPIPVNIPNPMDAVQKGMALGKMALEQQQMQRQVQTQMATRQAYVDNTDSAGNLDRQGFMSQLGQVDPIGAQAAKANFADTDKKQAEAQSAQIDAAQKALSLAVPTVKALQGMPEDQRAAAYPAYMQNLKANGVDTSQWPDQYDPGHFQQAAAMTMAHVPALTNYLANQATQATTAETQAKTALTQAELPTAMKTKAAALNADLYGSRSPNAELTSQYDKQAAPVRSSQMAMQQMIDNYKNPSPQGDASLKLNAFKIKFPTAPDVNSLDELSKSQSATDQMKLYANHLLSGGFDQATKDNLMRDAASTYSANVASLRGMQQKYQARQAQQGVNDPTLTAEPAIDKTFSDVTDLKKQLGPYVPPSQRGGIMAGINGLMGKITGTGGDQPASAATSGMIKMKSPDGRIKMVPVGMKGEAIAAGGSVVKE